MILKLSTTVKILFLIISDHRELKEARLSSKEASSEVTPPKNFTIQLLYNEKNGTISCNDDELDEKNLMNPCDIDTFGNGSVY